MKKRTALFWLQELYRLDDGRSLHQFILGTIGIVPAPKAAKSMSRVGRFLAGEYLAELNREHHQPRLVKGKGKRRAH